MNELPWELAILLSKFVAYISFLSVTGGVFVLCLGVSRRPDQDALSSSAPLWSAVARRALTHFLLFFCALGCLSVALFFVLQVGLINQDGLAGMMDWLMLKIIAQTAVGKGTAFKLAGFLVLGIALLYSRRRLSVDALQAVPIVLQVSWMFGVALLCLGFAQLGHVASLEVLAKLAIGVHVLAAGLWIGALYPLYLLCQSEPGSRIYPLMKRFGDWGWFITIGLVLAGVYLLMQLLASPREFISTAYGALLLAKVLLACSLLVLGALNKFRLVPDLLRVGAQPLGRSIRLEMLIALLVLLLTATLSTVTGPAHLMG